VKPIVVARGEKSGDSDVAALGASVTLAKPANALFFRGSLPGAFGYDQAAYALRVQIEAGAHPLDLLPLAFPASWLVNSKAPSTLFQRLVFPDMLAHWETIATHLHENANNWATASAVARLAVQQAVAALATVPQSSLASITKVLALLLPSQVPIMADSEVWYATGKIEAPSKADGESAPSECFADMMNWYDARQAELGAQLIELAAAHPLAPLLPRQVLDRLVWYAAWGARIDPANQAQT
jgi:hypothetical protein